MEIMALSQYPMALWHGLSLEFVLKFEIGLGIIGEFLRNQALFILTTIMWFLSVSVAVSATPEVAVNRPKYYPHYLYRVELNGLTSWVFGTMHIPGVKVSDFQALSEILPSMQAMILEKDPNAPEEDFFDLAIEAKGFASKPGLSAVLNNKPFDRYKRFVKRYFPEDPSMLELMLMATPGIAFEFILKMALNPPPEPGQSEAPLVQTSQAEAIANRVSESSSFDVLDMDLFKAARALNIPVVAMDTIRRDHLYYIEKVDRALLNSFILEMIEPSGKLKTISYHQQESLTEDQRKDWDQGTADYLAGHVLSSKQEGSSPVLRLLLNRDLKWLPEILSEASSRPIFVAVGLEHVIRPGGILAYLRAIGAKVTPAQDIFEPNCEATLSSAVPKPTQSI